MNTLLDKITVADLRNICKNNFRTTSREAISRANLYIALSRQPTSIKQRVLAEALNLSKTGKHKFARRAKQVNPSLPDTRYLKRARLNDSSSQGTDINGDEVSPDERISFQEEDPVTEDEHPCAEIDAELCGNDFMVAPDDATIDDLIFRFKEATGNDTVKCRPCGISARDMLINDLTTMALDAIPNREKLTPLETHPSHFILHGMLLYPRGLSPDRTTISLCHNCLYYLKKNEIPRLSLANNMWIGDVPYQLSNLTLAERLMIAKGFPCAYIFKLYPKQKGAANWDKSQFHNGIKGNVSTYKMNPSQLAEIICGPILPHPSRILSAMIGVTFVGPKGVRESTMPDIFRVRRWRVREALCWLQKNNPLYEDVTISEERLTDLPEDGIPDEILATTRYSSDVSSLNRENEGYVPEYDEEEADETVSSIVEDVVDETISNIADEDDVALEARGENDAVTEPCTFEVQALGVVDVSGDDITSDEIMIHALSNGGMPKIQKQSEDFTIRRGSAFVNEYARKDPVTGQRNDGGPSDPNHLLGAFPTLFPYGKGGFETKRPVDVPYETHARWAMMYHDKRFRKDPQFPFQVFGVCQKREVCRSSVLQIKKSAFAQDIALISTIRPQDLIKASQEESRKVRFSNPAVRALRRNLTAVKSKVKGTDESRLEVRSKIWGMTLAYNPPSLWITINPADTQDPIAQVMTGSEIDLDRFSDLSRQSSSHRASNIAGDPFASARFFHFMITMIIETLFGIVKTSSGRLTRNHGIFGKVQGYIGTVEAQGRGSLHIHMIIWLSGAPTSQNMKNLLKREDFRDRVTRYIASVIKADVDGLTSNELLQIEPTQNISYSRPFNPRTTTAEEKRILERSLARTLQVHHCSINTCKRIVRGKPACKRRAPFATAAREWIDEEGDWGPKRTSDMVNAWNPPTLFCLRANNDIKLITNGRLTAKLTFYITSYATKKQQTSSNVTALLAKTLAFHKNLERRGTDIKAINKRLVQRCANSLTKNREFSAPEVISYIMGWGDSYASHHFSAIYLNAIVAALKAVFPSLTEERTLRIERTHKEEADMTVYFADGSVNLKDQLRDYRYRGIGLSHMNLLTFLLETYEGEILPTSNNTKRKREGSRNVGRPPNERHEYLSAAKKGKLCRIVRSKGHETVPRICGAWFPRRDRQNEVELHRATMLALLMPWRNMEELKDRDESFERSYNKMIAELGIKEKRFINNAQYYHECLDGAKEPETERIHSLDQRTFEPEDMNGDATYVTPEQPFPHDPTKEEIEVARTKRVPAAERLFGEAAIDIAMDYNIFSDSDTDHSVSKISDVASALELERINQWESQLREFNQKSLAATFENSDRNPGVSLNDNFSEPHVAERQQALFNMQMGNESSSYNASMQESLIVQKGKERQKLSLLNKQQRIAHDIIEETLLAHIEGKADQLKMLVLGAGGTGKSLLINAISETFRYHNQEQLLSKCATTGIAASDIGGTTLHNWASLSVARSQTNKWIEVETKKSKKKRRKNIEGRAFLIVDEISMQDKQFLYDSSLAVSKVKGEEGWEGSACKPYGGMHVIMFGDFHQFPPVKNTPGALYVDRSNDSSKAKLGREIFLQFDRVVILDEQVRVTDRTWSEILGKVRIGQCSESDVNEIRKLVLDDEGCDVPNFEEGPWKDAVLVTSRHAVRQQWNEYSVRKHCSKTGNRCYTVPSEDFERNSPDRLSMNAKMAAAMLKDRKTGNLEDEIQLAIGMKAMVKVNYAVDADIANGTRGTIEAIILDPRDVNPEVDEHGDVRLKYPPAMVLFRPNKPSHILFDGLEPGLIPITPSVTTFAAKYEKKTYNIIRRQYAITPAYAFTDYKAQGQTIEYVIIDIANPPEAKISAFGIYVALSRSRGRKNIRLLRDFDVTIFQHHPSEYLRKDMERLEELDRRTRAEWKSRADDLQNFYD